MTVREIPMGSGIHGRPILGDNKRHIARYTRGRWVTWCAQVVPLDHQCPPYNQVSAAPGAYPTCWDCDYSWRKENGMPILQGHPAALSS